MLYTGLNDDILFFTTFSLFTVFLGKQIDADVPAIQDLIKNSQLIFILFLIITVPYFITKSIIYQQLPENKFAELHKDYNINTVYNVNAFTIMSM